MVEDVNMQPEGAQGEVAEPIRLLDGGVRADCWAGFSYLRWVRPRVVIEDAASEVRASLTSEGLDKAGEQGLDTVLQITLQTSPRVLDVTSMPPRPPGHELW